MYVLHAHAQVSCPLPIKALQSDCSQEQSITKNTVAGVQSIGIRATPSDKQRSNMKHVNCIKWREARLL